ncbi:hypothetical protein R3X28_02285 [Maribacter sp. TH_r10]|uniref:hypothetical protein n=1 Tax=Maribacter sp. TH_r10 TaxID=3082086 RepID=UPI0029553D10|nr:hypothetical protein [Maribacter sp. TH_r10]MDV7137681.1 hypothetical protein [Maribacter sp. TH_r10]
MRKTISIIGMLLALVIIVSSFLKNEDTGQFFGYEINIWLYRLIWLVLFGIILNGYLKESKNSG